MWEVVCSVSPVCCGVVWSKILEAARSFQQSHHLQHTHSSSLIKSLASSLMKGTMSLPWAAGVGITLVLLAFLLASVDRGALRDAAVLPQAGQEPDAVTAAAAAAHPAPGTPPQSQAPEQKQRVVRAAIVRSASLSLPASSPPSLLAPAPLARADGAVETFARRPLPKPLLTGPPPPEGPALAHTELGGAVLVNAKDLGPKETMEDCRVACLEKRGCNVWVYCAAEPCAPHSCWLKRVDDPEHPVTRATGHHVPWTSGTWFKDAAQSDLARFPPLQELSHITLQTEYGDIRIRLMPGWSAGSVDYVRRVAAHQLCANCELYRVEPGFVLQGIIGAVIPPNTELKEGPKLMERGEVGWAGGFAGPDFFIYLGHKPAFHFGTSHTVWGVLDEESLLVAERIVALPSNTPRGPGTMRFLDRRLEFNVVPS